jgi:DNA-binding NarL/FixJ family response regulator
MPRRVLLIDDDDFVAVSLRGFLVQQNWDVDVSLEPHAAEALMRNNRYDVVLVDPYLTGALHDPKSDLIRIARQLEPNAALIVLTAYWSSELARAAAECEVAALLRKPQPVTLLEYVLSGASGGRTADEATSQPLP